MNIYLNSLYNYSVYFLKEKVIVALTEQQQKILIIASVAFSCLATCYYIRCCWGKSSAEIKEVEKAKNVQEPAKIESEMLTEAAHNLMKYFDENVNFQTEGIFRISGYSTTIDELVYELEKYPSYVITENPGEHELAGALKILFGKMELFTQAQIIELGTQLEKENEEIDEEENIQILRTAVAQLPEHQKLALEEMMDILGKVSDQSATNLMTTSNLALVFGPRLFKMETKPGEDPMKEMMEAAARAKKSQKVAGFMIDYREEIFA